MTVLRAALLFDHPTTRLFASRILESFFFCSLILLFLHFGSFLSFATSRLALRTSTPGTFLLWSLRSGSFSPSCYRGPVPSFHTSHLLSRSSVNKRTRAKEESKAFRVLSSPAVYLLLLLLLLLLSLPSLVSRC